MTLIRSGRTGVLAVSVVAIVGCASESPRAGGTVIRDSLGIEIVENAGGMYTAPQCRVSEEPIVSLGSVSGPEETQFFRVWRVKRLRDGGIAVINQGTNELRIFDADGTYRRSIGRTGEGPNEYSRMWAVYQRPDDSLVIWDYRQQRISIVSLSGELGRTFRLDPPFQNPPTLVGLTSGNGLLLWQRYFDRSAPTFSPVTLHLMEYDSKGQLVDTLGQFPYGVSGAISTEMRLFAGRLFEARTQVAAGTGFYAVAEASKREVWLHDFEGRPIRVIRWTGGDLTVSDDDVKAYFDRRLEEATSDESRRLTELLAENQPVADMFPSVSYMTTDNADRLWVFEYQRPEDERAPPVLIFGRDGRLVCSVRLPDSGFIDAVGEDWILAMEEDEDNVQYVRMYRLEGPVE